MSLWYILGIALGLAMDAFAVSVATGTQLGVVNSGHIFRLAFNFGLFQFLMPILGWLAGQTLAEWISAVDHWIAFGLLTAIGGRMLWESFRSEGGWTQDPTRGWLLLTLAVATSIDALAVGVGLAFLNVSIWVPSVVIGIVAALLTAVGVTFGSRLGQRFGHWAERFGAVVLIGIGLRVLVQHLTS